MPIAGSSQVPPQSASTSWTRSPTAWCRTHRFAEAEQDRLGLVQQGEHPQRTLRGDQVEIGYAAPEQRVSLTEFVVDVQSGHHRDVPRAWLVHAQQIGDDLAQRPRDARRRGG